MPYVHIIAGVGTTGSYATLGSDRRNCVSLSRVSLPFLPSTNIGETSKHRDDFNEAPLPSELVMRTKSPCLLSTISSIHYFIARLLATRCVSRGKNALFGAFTISLSKRHIFILACYKLAARCASRGKYDVTRLDILEAFGFAGPSVSGLIDH